MTTYYVSSVGNDSYTGLAPVFTSGTTGPFASFANALSTIADGDTINILSGTYNTNSANGFTFTKSVTVDPYAGASVTLTAGVAGQVVYLNPGTSAKTINIGAITLNAANFNNFGISAGSSAALQTVSLTGTIITNSLQAGYENSQTQLVFTGTNCNVTGANSHGAFEDVSGGLIAGSSATITGGSWISTALTLTARGGIFIRGGAASIPATISGATVTTTTVGAINSASIRLQNLVATIYDNTVTIAGAATAGLSIECAPINANQADGGAIYNNKTYNLCAAGINGILVGTDVSGANNDKMNNWRVYGNTVNGNDTSTGLHGVMFGNVSGGLAYGNTINRASLAVVLKQGAAASYAYSNKIYNPHGTTSGVIRIKGAVGSKAYNNNVYLSSSYTSGYVLYGSAGDAAQACSGCEFNNNVVYLYGATPTFIVRVDNSQDCTFDANDYYNPAATLASMWSFQGTTYATLAAWNAAAAVGIDYEVNPLFASVSALDYRLMPGSPLHRSGKYMASNVDFRGRTRMVPPAIGAYEPSRGDPPIVVRT